jgi:hypothetical protein
MSLEFFRSIPIATPIGAANAKAINSLMALLYSAGSLKFLLRDTPREIASGDL